MDYYKILNVNKDSSLAEIKQAYTNLSSFYDPSKNTSKNAYKKYREINKAYLVLSEIKQRELYNMTLKDEEIKEKVIDNSSLVKVNDYLKNKVIDKENYKDIEINSEYNPKDIYINLQLPYLYYLVNSDYLIKYRKKEFIQLTDKECELCHGLSKVSKDNKVCLCPKCLGSGKQGKIDYIDKKEIIHIDNENIILNKEDYKVFIKIEFINKEYYTVKNNEIFIDYKVNENEYFKGINFLLNKQETSLNITSNDYSDATYTFLDKIIHIHYNLTKYNGRDKLGYLLSDEKIIYLNPSDYTYSNIIDKDHTFKVNLNKEEIVLEGLGEKGYNASNGNLIIKVIKINNKKDNFIFFDRKIKKVSSNLFKFKGVYNNHKFNKFKKYDYDNNYIYLPNKAYKLKMKSYSLFKILFPILYLLVPFILYFIMGFNFAYLITCICLLLVYVIGSVFLMEVRV